MCAGWQAQPQPDSSNSVNTRTHLATWQPATEHVGLLQGKEGTFQFLETVLQEVMDLFPCNYIHIGGDEVCPASPDPAFTHDLPADVDEQDMARSRRSGRCFARHHGLYPATTPVAMKP